MRDARSRSTLGESPYHPWEKDAEDANDDCEDAYDEVDFVVD